MRSLIDVFAEEAPRLITEMREALAAAAPERFARAAHCLKTDSRTFGATRLAAAAVDALTPEIADALAALQALAGPRRRRTGFHAGVAVIALAASQRAKGLLTSYGD